MAGYNIQEMSMDFEGINIKFTSIIPVLNNDILFFKLNLCFLCWNVLNQKIQMIIKKKKLTVG